MAEYQVLDWLNENQYRAYPLRHTPNKEVRIEGAGVVALNDNTQDGYHIIDGVKTDFLNQFCIGDTLVIPIDGQQFISEVVRVLSPAKLLVRDSHNSSLSHSYQTYIIIKQSNSLDSISSLAENKSRLNLDAILLDANLVFLGNPAIVYLQQITVFGNDLLITVSNQLVFTVSNYSTAQYPFYARNETGSLLVIGEAAKFISTDLFFQNQIFEPSTCNFITTPWLGVSSVSFTGSTALTGAIELLEGYQTAVTTVEPETISVKAGKEYGKPIGCDVLFADHISADCGTIVSSINSMALPSNMSDFQLTPGSNVAIYNDPDNHKVYIGLNFSKGDVCKTLPPRPVQ